MDVANARGSDYRSIEAANAAPCDWAKIGEVTTLGRDVAGCCGVAMERAFGERERFRADVRFVEGANLHVPIDRRCVACFLGIA